MKLREYFEDKLFFIISNFIIFATIAVLLFIGNIGSGIIFLISCFWFIPLFTYIILDFYKSKKFYDNITNALDNLDRKYLLPEVIEEPNFYHGKFLYEVLKETDKDMHEQVKKYKLEQKEYREYIETWVHEIKTPIASTRLILENNESKMSETIKKEIKKIEEYIDQALYYARSTDVSKDYIVREFSLGKSVRNVIKKNSRDFINKRIAIDLEDLDYNVYSDEKWVEFIINQIINNAIKYSSENSRVKVSANEFKNSIILKIKDSGVGIPNRDLGRVFEKGFTGENGRRFTKSTGMGLYLCKNLCEKLGLGIKINSEENEGTEVSIVFPVGNALMAK
ncbi:ATP-binding protein [Clostridium sp. LIBA-8841]|uniref:ATP-binding protein n=1 Tax=Clostridium sp. LIBA-8841 TaxID=2987530 RepID=UPI002AC74153|nr:ATP-binding protein [Clostridium sp. LIBA-8841]MDZ5253917.1 ATP-binding protein [Clostridium sp. LIBA-8841]